MNSNLLRMTIVFLTMFVTYAVAAETSEQTEKQRAKEFLVRNMQGSYTFANNNLTHYYSYLHDVFSSPNEFSNNQYRAAYAKALNDYPFVMKNEITVACGNEISHILLALSNSNDWMYSNISNNRETYKCIQ